MHVQRIVKILYKLIIIIIQNRVQSTGVYKFQEFSRSSRIYQNTSTIVQNVDVKHLLLSLWKDRNLIIKFKINQYSDFYNNTSIVLE